MNPSASRSSLLWLAAAMLAAIGNFVTTGFAMAHRDFTLATLAAVGGTCFLIVFGYRAARTDWVDYS